MLGGDRGDHRQAGHRPARHRAGRRRRRCRLQRRRHRPAARLPRDPVSGGRAPRSAPSGAHRLRLVFSDAPHPLCPQRCRRPGGGRRRPRRARGERRPLSCAGPAAGAHPASTIWVEARYPQQTWEIEVPLAWPRADGRSTWPALVDDFHAAHQAALRRLRSGLAGRVHRLACPRQRQSRPSGRTPACAPPPSAREQAPTAHLARRLDRRSDVHRLAAIAGRARSPARPSSSCRSPPSSCRRAPRPPPAVRHPRGDRMSDDGEPRAPPHPRTLGEPPATLPHGDPRQPARDASRARWRIRSTAPAAPASSTPRATSPAASSPRATSCSPKPRACRRTSSSDRT